MESGAGKKVLSQESKKEKRKIEPPDPILKVGARDILLLEGRTGFFAIIKDFWGISKDFFFIYFWIFFVISVGVIYSSGQSP